MAYANDLKTTQFITDLMPTIEVSEDTKEVLDILIKAGDFKGYDELINYLIEVAFNSLGEGGD